MDFKAYEFDAAIVRRPARAVTSGAMVPRELAP